MLIHWYQTRDRQGEEVMQPRCLQQKGELIWGGQQEKRINERTLVHMCSVGGAKKDLGKNKQDNPC